MARYALTIFLSAFLLFLVQPLIGKYILPWFGGTPAVWTTCMLFFQMVLLAGYAYAHLLAARMPTRKQANLHLILLAVSLAFLPIAPREFFKPTNSESPEWKILLLLTVTIGPPYLLLSSTGPLLQSWFSRTHAGRSPYRLYSLSNLGSLLALFCYPFVVEPNLRRWDQAVVWSVGYGLFALVCGWCAWRLRQLSVSPATIEAVAPVAAAANQEVGVEAPSAGWADIGLWLVLSMCGSVMLLATTNMICQELSVTPFLWILPLAIYLLSFIICFDNPRWYARWLFLPLLALSVGWWVWLLAHDALTEFVMTGNLFEKSPLPPIEKWVGTRLDTSWTTLFGASPFPWLHTYVADDIASPAIYGEIGSYLLVLFACVMTCHGELVRGRPHPRQLTLFYLTIAAGGALGGVFVALIAPHVFPWFWEYQIGLGASCAAVLWANINDRNSPKRWIWAGLRWSILAFGAVLLCPLVAILISQTRLHDASNEWRKMLSVSRNFYGVLRVTEEEDDDNGPKYSLTHGEIMHGFQYQQGMYRNWPTSYYGPTTGIAVAMSFHPKRFATEPEKQALRVGVVGLGTGSIAALCREGDYLRYYEINSAVIDLSKKWFTYLADSKAKEIDIALGDARVSMEHELAEGESQRFDVLAIDAFSSDSIPMHLLTKECGELYWKHLNEDGILALHISNKFLDLSGVAQALADVTGKKTLTVDTKDDNSIGQSGSTWVLVTTNEKFLNNEAMLDTIVTWSDEPAAPILWTDDFASLRQVLSP